MINIFIKSPDVACEVRRLSSVLVNLSVNYVNTRTDDPDVIIHNLRKNVKNLRALLKLIKTETGNNFYRKNNNDLKNYNRISADIRNLISLITLTKSLHVKGIYSGHIKQLLLKLELDLFEERGKVDYDKMLYYYKTELQKYKLRLNELKPFKYTFSSVEKGLKGFYASSVRFMNMSIGKPGESELHEWRKSVKNLYHSCYILTPLNSKYLKPFTENLKLLSDKLGDIHDFYILKNYITLAAAQKNFSPLIAFINDYQCILVEDSLAMGKKLFAEHKAHFIKRIRSYYREYKKKFESRKDLIQAV